MYFTVYTAGCYFHISFIVKVNCDKKHILNLLILKAGLKYKQKPRKINVKDFILFSVARITPLTWNTFSCSNKLFSLLRTYPRQKLLINTNIIYFSNQKRKNLSFFTTVLSFKLKKYQHNTSTAACNLYSNFPETYLQSFPINKTNHSSTARFY